MSFAAYFAANPPMTKDQFDQINADLEAIGQTNPVGRLAHVAYGPDHDIKVIDVWDNEANFQAFGALLMPIIATVGVNIAPQIEPVQRVLPEPATSASSEQSIPRARVVRG